MFNKEKHPINYEWEIYYQKLENIREDGICNMWGASPYLKEAYPDLSYEQCTDILLSWIANYDELNSKYGWRLY